MTKKTIAVTIDFDVYVIAKKKLDNISNEVNELLKKRLNVEKSEIDKTIEELKIDRETKLAEAQALSEALEKIEIQKEKEKDDVLYSWSDENEV